MIKKTQILEAARLILSNEGIDQLSLRKIAKETGCAAPSIYYYFNNKQAIVIGLWEQTAQTLTEGLQQSADPSEHYRDFWLNKPNEFRLFICHADYFPAIENTPMHSMLSKTLGSELFKLNGELMASIFIARATANK